MRLSFILAIVLFMTSCDSNSGSGNVISEKRNTEAFRGVHAENGFEVEITKGPTHSVTIEADDDILKSIKTDVENGILKIRLRKNNLSNVHLKAFITSPEMEEINASSGAEVKVNGSFASLNTASYKASSAAKIFADIDAPKVRADASSSGEIRLTGRTRQFHGECSSAGEIDAKNLMAETGNVQSSSGATLQVYASMLLDASASSGGSIQYKGGAKVKKSESSGGEVNAID